MTTTPAPQQYQPFPASPSRPTISQATAIEQQRAIAEVQAAVVVAQNCPRDIGRAEADMYDSCGRMAMAEQAFYAVDNRGTGPSVHLMRELARIWGNVQFGVNELARNDDKGESEVQAWAWDVQTNTRSSRTFIVPHQRMKKGTRVDLTDLQDIYLNNQNIGARAVRECIATVLPRWYTETAQNVCRQTLEIGDGEPLNERITNMINGFGQIGITVKQMESRLGKPRDKWNAGDIAQMKIAYTSITRDGIDKDEVFPAATAASSSAADILSGETPAVEQPKPQRRSRTKQPKDYTGEPTKADQEPAKPEQPAQDSEQAAADASEQEPVEPHGSDDPEPAEDPEPADPAPTAEDAAAEPEPEPAPEPAKPEKSQTRRALERRLFKLLGASEVHEREDRLIIYRFIVGRNNVNSTDDLNDVEVAKVCDQLYTWQQQDQLDQQITDILNSATLALESAEQETDQ